MNCAGNALLADNLRLFEGGIASVATVEALRAVKTSRLSVSPEGGWVFEDAAKGLRILLQSRRNPEAEALRQCEVWLHSEVGRSKGLIVLIGAGGFCQVKALSSKLSRGSTILVLEPAPDLLAGALTQGKLSDLEREGIKLLFCSNPDLLRMLDELRLELRRLPRLDVAVFVNPGPVRTDPALYKRLEAGVEEKLRLETTHRETLARFSNEWILNSLANLPAALRSAKVDALTGLFKGSSALIVGAGPSLEGALEFIKPFKNSFVVIAAGTALKPLLAAGIEPDFVVGVDSDPKTLRQFEGLPLKGTRLVCSLNVHPELPPRFEASRRIFFSVNLSGQLNSWLEGKGLLPAKLHAAGTVAVSAMDLARLLGCDKLVLCGVDLAMSADGFTHAAGSIYEGQRESGLTPVPGNRLASVMTNWQFLNYISMTGDFLGELRKRHGIETFNLSDTGARIENARPLGIERLESFVGASPEEGRGKLDSSPGAPAGDFSKARQVFASSISWLERLAANPSELSSLVAEKDNPRMLLEALLEAKSYENGGAHAGDGAWMFSMIPPTALALAAALRKAQEGLA